MPLHVSTALRVILAAVLLGVAAVTYFTDLDANDFDGDEYAYALEAHEPLAEFFSEWRPLLGLQFVPLLRAAERIYDDPDPYLFHKKLALTRIPSGIVGLMTLAAVLLLVPRTWPGAPAIALTVAGFVAFNEATIPYHRWGMLIFAEYLLLSTLLYFMFLFHLKSPVGPIPKVVTAVLVIVLPFVYFPTLPPFVTGWTGVILIRALGDNGPWRTRLAHAVKHSRLVALAIPAYIGAVFFEPWSLSRRVSTADFFYPTSEDAGSAVGPILFLIRKTAAHFGKLVLPATGLGTVVDVVCGAFAIGCMGIAVAWTIVSVVRRRSSDRDAPASPTSPTRLFTVWYVVATTLVIATLSLLGLYPYGLPRYSMYMLVPVLVLAGMGIEDSLNAVRGRFGNRRATPGPAVYVGLALVFVVLGVARVQALHREWRALDRLNAEIRELIIDSGDELVIFSAPIERYFQILSPETLANARMVAAVQKAVNQEMNFNLDTEALASYLAEDSPRLKFAYWGRRPPETQHPQIAAILDQNGWIRSDLVQQEGENALVCVAAYVRAGDVHPALAP